MSAEQTIHAATASTYIQWKGTGSVCMDFRCTCGAMPHVHGDFAYAVRCAECGTVWMMPDTFRLEKADPSYTGCVIEADEEWDTKTNGFVFNTTCDNVDEEIARLRARIAELEREPKGGSGE